VQRDGLPPRALVRQTPTSGRAVIRLASRSRRGDRRGRAAVMVRGEAVQPRLHLTIQEIVATEIIDDDPREAFETADWFARARTRPRWGAPHARGLRLGADVGRSAPPGQRQPRGHVLPLAALGGSFDRAFAQPAQNRVARRAAARRARHGPRRALQARARTRAQSLSLGSWARRASAARSELARDGRCPSRPFRAAKPVPDRAGLAAYAASPRL
jgi:hypothetical protein